MHVKVGQLGSEVVKLMQVVEWKREFLASAEYWVGDRDEMVHVEGSG